MSFTADVATALLRAVGVPVFREGQFLTLPGGTFEVASVCAGLGYLTAGTVIALLFSYFTYRSAVTRLVFVMLTAILMVLTNAVRAFVIMYVASATGMRYLTGRDHVFFGWILFGVVVVALIYAGGRFADEEAPGEHAVASGGSPRARLLPLVLGFGLLMFAATAQPLETGLRHPWLWLLPVTALFLWTLYKTVDSLHTGSSIATGGVYYRSAAGILVLAIAPLTLAAGPGLLLRPTAPDQDGPLRAALPVIDGCSDDGGWSERWEPEYRLPDGVMSGAYLCAGQRVDVFAATYVGNAQGRELVNDSNKAVPDALQWRAVTLKNDFTSRDGQRVRVNELSVEESGGSSLIWYWYQTGDTSATSSVSVKFEQAMDVLLMRRTVGTVYVLHTAVDQELGASRARLARVARELAPCEPARTAQADDLARHSPK